jgi:hypothetical protein
MEQTALSGLVVARIVASVSMEAFGTISSLKKPWQATRRLHPQAPRVRSRFSCD